MKYKFTKRNLPFSCENQPYLPQIFETVLFIFSNFTRIKLQLELVWNVLREKIIIIWNKISTFSFCFKQFATKCIFFFFTDLLLSIRHPNTVFPNSGIGNLKKSPKIYLQNPTRWFNDSSGQNDSKYKS